ncbi:DUF4625 domain-containing protein [Maribellus maritimus]|uniref:DUF4625 domain-containing protein n=1 Tax=Maribellus maritimus TaxID=2870838 RepID=UPI001EECDECD|nr:DUF4625 domain-containing protein [Maribellus maritimus]MCG6189875.1 DUF4625 domain-containing protein [Maribellus maritimus]
MKTTFRTLILIFIASGLLLLASCGDDDFLKPVITISELGLGDSRVAYAGTDLHIEAEIEAAAGINMISVEIHQEEGSSDEIEVEYDEFSGLKNMTFHKHIEIPAETPTGTYHVHVTVTDLEGYQTTVEDEIEIEELTDEEAPEIIISSAPESGMSFSSGETISISGTITDNISLAGILVALVYESDNIADTDVAGDNTSVIVMLHTHDFDDPDETEFSASIEVGAENDNNMTPAAIEGDNAWKSGNYYILVKSKDVKANWAYSNHYQLTVNY